MPTVSFSFSLILFGFSQYNTLNACTSLSRVLVEASVIAKARNFTFDEVPTGTQGKNLALGMLKPGQPGSQGIEQVSLKRRPKLICDCLRNVRELLELCERALNSVQPQIGN
jgi:hypothetical protein